MRSLRLLFTETGFPFSDRKFRFAEVLTILGLIFHGGVRPHVEVDANRIAQICNEIDRILMCGLLPAQVAAALCGRAHFALISVAGATWQSLLRPLYMRAAATGRSTSLSAAARLSLISLKGILSNLPTRATSFIRQNSQPVQSTPTPHGRL